MLPYCRKTPPHFAIPALILGILRSWGSLITVEAWLPRVKYLVCSAPRVQLPRPSGVKNAEGVVRSVYRLTVGCQVLTGRQLHMR